MSSIQQIINQINNENAENGGLWLPNIQRTFVWSEEQIETLFDSILRGYPISSLLFWKTMERIKSRKFIQNFNSEVKLKDFYNIENRKRKTFVLDGQQRLQSLYIGLKGSYENKRLCLNLTSGTEKEDNLYNFRFLEKSKIVFPWVEFSAVIDNPHKFVPQDILNRLLGKKNVPINDEDIAIYTRNIQLARQIFLTDNVIIYNTIDSTDENNEYTYEDILEIFIRANSGGTSLEKSDLMFSLLMLDWDDADTKIEDFLSELNKHGFEFTRDFVIKTSMVLLGHGSKYDVNKLRNPDVRKDINDKWSSISDSIKQVFDFIRKFTKITTGKAIPSYIPLIPLIYFSYNHPNKWKKSDCKSHCETFLLKTLLSGAMSGSSDGIVDALVKNIKESEDFNSESLFSTISNQRRSITISEHLLFGKMGYGSNYIHLLFNLWYNDTEYSPSSNGNQLQVDHIFPQSKLGDIKEINTVTNRQVKKYDKNEINQLANCMLLTKDENGAGGKSDKLPIEWLKGKPNKYFIAHCIPQDKSLWEINNYEKFIEERKKLIKLKLKSFITS